MRAGRQRRASGWRDFVRMTRGSSERERHECPELGRLRAAAARAAEMSAAKTGAGAGAAVRRCARRNAGKRRGSGGKSVESMPSPRLEQPRRGLMQEAGPVRVRCSAPPLPRGGCLRLHCRWKPCGLASVAPSWRAAPRVTHGAAIMLGRATCHPLRHSRNAAAISRPS